MAESGSVAWQFEKKGVIVVDVPESEAENIALIAIDAGADDFETYDGTLHIYSDPGTLEDIRSTLTKSEAAISSSELSLIPSSTLMLESGKAIQTLRLLDTLEELEDVQKVYSNADFPEDALVTFQVG
jgi:transcriptional/translational regulatory protein YebC/TACO1